MNSSWILSKITFVYALAGILYVAAWNFKQDKLTKYAFYITAAGAVGNIAGFVLRWVESYQQGIGHAPLSNMYESLVFFAISVAVLYMYVEIRYKKPIIGAFALPIAFLIMAYASLSPDINDKIQPLLPALQSNWLIAHVMTCFLGYAAFAIAFGLSLIFFIKKMGGVHIDQKTSLIPDDNILDDLTHQMVMFGFLFLSVGIITGSVWANSAWGKYWSWDPKETWSLITWFVYAAFLHARLMHGWRGTRLAIISIVGFCAVIFTYFGVNFLLSGLHSYGS